MIKEAYVSFEVAKLLKEKGFNERSVASYDSKGQLQEGYGYWNKTPMWCAAPTLQMAMKWLREKHNIYMDIAPTHSANGSIDFIWQTYDSDYSVTGDCDIFYHTYEEAVEAALKYVLENLI